MSDIKLLYVEDEPALAHIVKESLERKNYLVKWVSDGSEALNGFRLFQPDLCILDIMLPNINGYDIAEALRNSNKEIPIIFLSAKNQTQDVVKGFEVGANDYLKKPFSIEELDARIKNLLKLKGNADPEKKVNPLIKLGRYKYFPLKQELKFASESTQLSHKENQLVQILSQHINTNVDRKKILLEIWGDDSYFNSRNLDVYITKLRKVFKKDSDIQIITLKGVGYLFRID